MAEESEEKTTFNERIEEQLELLNNRMEKQILIKDELITRLHDELEYYKKGSASQFENQLLKAVIKIQQDMKKNLSNEAFAEKSPKDLLEEYRYIFEDITDMLTMQNCDEILSNPGDPFDPAIHQAKAEITDNQELHKTIKCSVKPGYRKGDTILIPERVIVYQYQDNK